MTVPELGPVPRVPRLIRCWASSSLLILCAASSREAYRDQGRSGKRGTGTDSTAIMRDSLYRFHQTTGDPGAQGCPEERDRGKCPNCARLTSRSEMTSGAWP